MPEHEENESHHNDSQVGRLELLVSQLGSLAARVTFLGTRVDLEISHTQDLINQRLDAEKIARDLQAREYERRLGELNESRQEAREKFNDYLDKKQFQLQFDDLEKRIDDNHTQLIGMSTIPADLRALFTWREEVNRVIGRVENLSVQLTAAASSITDLGKFKQDMLEWRSRVLGIAIGVAAVCGAVSGLISHWILK